MSKRTSTARYTLPLEINPATTVDFCVRVPNDIYHIGAFLGQIYALSRAYSWQNDSAHSALLVAAVWREIFDGLKPGCDCPTPVSGSEGEENLIRQNPENPCLLETSINGTDWCAFADLSKCVPAGAQPGGGTPQPEPGGGQVCYHAKMVASNKWLLPTLVSTGDVIQVTNASGSASDGTVVWRCPNGALFQLGACIGSGSTSGSDPLNTSPHMMLIAKINSTYYPMYNTSLTIPGGVSNAQVEFQLNDSSLSDNFGEITWDVCVTNNRTASWEHTFEGSELGTWLNVPGADNGLGYGAFNADGTWHSTCNVYGGEAFEAIDINRTIVTASTITEIQIYYTKTGTHGDHGMLLVVGATTLWSYIEFTASPMIWTGSQAAGTMRIAEALSHHVGSTSCYGDTGTITKIVVSGLGVDPF